MANDTSVSEFCTEQGIWASIKPLTLRLYVNPEGQLRAQGCARSSWAADGRHSWLAALRRHKSQFGMQIRSSGDRTDRQIAYRRISPPTGLDPVIALLLERMAEHACADTWRNIRDDLKGIQLAQLIGSNGTLWQVTEPRPSASNRLKSLRISPPPAILKLA